MIKHKTIVKISDNSGAKSAECIKILGGYKKKHGNIGDLIIVSIKTIKTNSNKLKIKKKTLFKGIIIQTKKFKHKKIGFKFNLKINSIILLDKNLNPLGNRFSIFLNDKLQKLKTLSIKIF